jgi:hypothetical protein
LEQARRSIPQPLRAATHETLIELLAATGLRIGEALASTTRHRHRLLGRGAADPPLEVRQVPTGAAAAEHPGRA